MEREVVFSQDKADYALLLAEIKALYDPDLPPLSNLSNMGALIASFYADINWCGFYLWQEARQRLVLGPFQGRPACSSIARGRGVCGRALEEGRPLIVPDVEAFPGHIACDSRSRSEFVFPLVWKGKLLGVLDIDSPKIGRFSESDAHGMSAIMDFMSQALTDAGIEKLLE